eukprot:1384967-Amorphochlora_amoeboformis.AAC.1
MSLKNFKRFSCRKRFGFVEDWLDRDWGGRQMGRAAVRDASPQILPLATKRTHRPFRDYPGYGGGRREEEGRRRFHPTELGWARGTKAQAGGTEIEGVSEEIIRFEI